MQDRHVSPHVESPPPDVPSVYDFNELARVAIDDQLMESVFSPTCLSDKMFPIDLGNRITSDMLSNLPSYMQEFCYCVDSMM